MEVQELKLPEEDTEMSKHVGESIIYRDRVVMYICAVVGFNKNIIKMHYTCIKIVP